MRLEGFVLAGGASSRMGEDKWRLPLGGRTLLERSVSALRHVTDRVAVVGDIDPDEVGGLAVVRDESPSGSAGPAGRAAIVGLYTALKRSRSEWVAVLACDLPFVSGELFETLALLAGDEFEAVVPRQADGRMQPLCALYARGASLRAAEDLMRAGEWSLGGFARRLKTQVVDFEDVRDLPGSEFFFLNVNTPDDYAAAHRIAEA